MNINKEPQRTTSLTSHIRLLKLQRRIIRTQRTTHRLRAQQWRNQARQISNDVAIPRNHDGRWRRWTGTGNGLLVVRGGVVAAETCEVACEGEVARTGEVGEVGGLGGVWEVEDEGAGFEEGGFAVVWVGVLVFVGLLLLHHHHDHLVLENHM